MNRLDLTRKQRALRAHRVRKNVRGTIERPRLSVFISNTHVTAQIIDDESGQTLVYATSVGSKEDKLNMTDKAAKLGVEIAKKAKVKKITKVVFDRGSQKYHGRIKALAGAARSNGLEF